jgi:large subunit ribosomal protein L4
MPTIQVINQEGKALHTLNIADAVFGIEPNQQAIFDTVLMQRASMRQGTHDVKNKSEVRGGGKKPWRQKGTGRARTGSTRNPHWRGGGSAFGPTPRSYAYRLNRKVRRLAVRSVLSEKFLNNELVIVDAIKFEGIKTKEFIKVQDAIQCTGNTLYVFYGEEDWDNSYMSMRNLPNTLFALVEDINIFDLMRVGKVVFTEAAVKYAQEVLA